MRYHTQESDYVIHAQPQKIQCQSQLNKPQFIKSNNEMWSSFNRQSSAMDNQKKSQFNTNWDSKSFSKKIDLLESYKMNV